MQGFWQGLAASAGWAKGRAHVLSAHALAVAHMPISSAQISTEQAQLKTAFAATLAELGALRQSIALEKHTELSAFIEVHELMLHDPVLVDETLNYIATHQVNAAWALSEQTQALAATFLAMDDAYLRERAFDVQQVCERVLKHLITDPAAHCTSEGAAPSGELILVARDLAPADFMHWQDVGLAGLITEVGGVSSHTAIVARAQGLPAVLALEHATRLIQSHDWVVIDGNTGRVWVNPSAAELGMLRALQDDWQNQMHRAHEDIALPAKTSHGETIVLLGNIESPSDMGEVAAAYLDGVGLMRSEFLFMGREQLPDEEEQFQAYAAVVKALAGKPATIRTLDVGADKLLNAAHAHSVQVSPNPALGLRAIRYSLAHPDAFLVQLRALLRAAAFGPVKILLPMVASAAEIVASRRYLLQAQQDLTAQGIAQGSVEWGVMIEIPGAAIAIDTLLPHIDFCSVGTNDLIQYTLAIDRTDSAVAHLYDPQHPALGRLLTHIFEACKAASTPVSVCGEMAGDPALTHHLLDLGLRSFSLNAVQAGAVKAKIRSWAGT